VHWGTGNTGEDFSLFFFSFFFSRCNSPDQVSFLSLFLLGDRDKRRRDELLRSDADCPLLFFLFLFFFFPLFGRSQTVCRRASNQWLTSCPLFFFFFFSVNHGRRPGFGEGNDNRLTLLSLTFFIPLFCFSPSLPWVMRDLLGLGQTAQTNQFLSLSFFLWSSRMIARNALGWSFPSFFLD